jgi:hypothetical protein
VGEEGAIESLVLEGGSRGRRVQKYFEREGKRDFEEISTETLI